MAKGYNPADAHRKAQKNKEKKKNQQERKSARELGEAKRSTGGLEREIKELHTKERNGKITESEKAQLTTARAELDKLRKTKEDYVNAHPEQRDAVMRESKAAQAARLEKEKGPQSVNVMGVRIGFKEKRQAEAQGLRFDKQGRLLNPEKSLYYDRVFNPYGVPPPGLPYRARPPTAEEMAAMQKTQEGDSDDDIIMPDGPPPGEEASDDDEEDSDSDDSDSSDIPLPSGPPPPKPTATAPPLPPGPPPLMRFAGPPSFPPAQAPPTGFYAQPPPPPPLAGPSHLALPSRPPPGTVGVSIAAKPNLQAHQSLPARPGSAGPARPQAQSKASEPPDPALLEKAKASATISAAPQVRDLKKEAMSFVPAALKRKRAAQGAGSAAKRVAQTSTRDTLDEAGQEQNERAAGPQMPGPQMALPPGFGPTSARQPQPLDAGEQGDEEYGEEQGMSLPPDYGDGYAPLPGFDDEDVDGADVDVGVALPPGYSRQQYSQDGYDDLEGEENGDMGDYQGVALPPSGGDDDAFPPLEGYGNYEDEEPEQEDQTVSLPPGYDRSSSKRTMVDEEDDEE